MDKRLEGISNELLIKAVIENAVMELGYINKALLSDEDVKNIITKIYDDGCGIDDVYAAVDDEIQDNYTDNEDEEDNDGKIEDNLDDFKDLSDESKIALRESFKELQIGMARIDAMKKLGMCPRCGDSEENCSCDGEIDEDGNFIIQFSDDAYEEIPEDYIDDNPYECYRCGGNIETCKCDPEPDVYDGDFEPTETSTEYDAFVDYGEQGKCSEE